MGIFSDKQLTIKEIWKLSFHLYFKALPQVWFQAALVSLVIFLLALLGGSSYCKVGTNDPITYIHIICFFIQILALLVIVYFGGVILYRTQAIGNDQSVTLYASFIFVGKKYFQMAMGVLLVMLICVLGTLLFVLPGIFLFVSLVMLQPLILFDNNGCLTSLKNSYNLVKNNWWRTFAVISPVMLFNLLNYLSGAFVQIVAYGLSWYITIIVGSIIISFIYPLFYACILVQFNDLKLRHQNNSAS